MGARLANRATCSLQAVVLLGMAINVAAEPQERLPPERPLPDRTAIQAELSQLRERIEALERLLSASAPDAASSAAEPVLPAAGGRDSPARQTPAVVEGDAGEARPVESVPEPWLDLGGALRISYSWLDYDRGSKERRGDFDVELFRLDLTGGSGPFDFSVQYRWYNDFDTVHHAWLGYQLSDATRVRLGVVKVPFGLLPVASHSFWFGATYYLGFEDDYDSGLELHHAADPWSVHLAFFKNAEYGSGRSERYSFDVVTGGDQQNEELNQFNGRLAYRWQHADTRNSEFGLSLMWGELHNKATRDHGERHAIAVHWDGNLDPWHLQLQWLDYQFRPANPVGVSDRQIQLGAFGAPFLIAAAGEVVTFNLARSFSTVPAPLDKITCYNDYSHVMPRGERARDSIQNVTGCLLTAGKIYAYLDWITGKNMWFIGGPGIGLSDDRWRSRFNVNIGYYF